MKDQGRGPATYVVPWAPHLLNWALDGPTSQYRNRSNFFLLANIPFILGFEYVTWNFLESGHGKGPADGVGAALKNSADRIVARGGDIKNVDDLFEKLEGTVNVTIYKISNDAMAESELHLHLVPPKSVKGTMKVHQLIVSGPGTFIHRTLSCYCTGSSSCHPCQCYSPKTESMPTIPTVCPTKPPSVLTRIENNHLTEQQKNLFEKRLAEGYDVEVLDLEALSPQEQNEYLLWKVWKTQVRPKPAFQVHKFYAVLFTRGVKKSFYIGCLLDVDCMKMKFLERVGDRSKYIFDWPRRDDILANTEPKFILKEVIFQGPPPFTLDTEEACQIQEMISSHQ